MQNISVASVLLDVMVILITGSFVWFGIRRGFLVTLVNSCGRLISCIGAYIGSRALATTIYQVYIREKLIDSIAESVTDSFAEYDVSMQVSTIMQEIPGIIRNMVYGVFGDTANLTSQIGDTLNGTVQTAATQVVDQVIYPVVYVVLQSILFLLLFFCLKIVIGALSETLRNIRKCLLIGAPDMLAGGVLGFLEAMLCIFVIVVFIKLLIYASGAQIPLQSSDTIESTTLFKIFYNASPFSGKWDL